MYKGIGEEIMSRDSVKKVDNNSNLTNIKHKLVKDSEFIEYADGGYKGPKKNEYVVVITNKNREIVITESNRAITFDSNIKAELIAGLRAM